MKTKLTHILLVEQHQIAFGARLGLDLTGCTVRVAGARIEDCIRSAFYGETPLRANEKQVALAAKFGYDIEDCTRRVAHAIVADLTEQLDRETVVAEGLAPGVTVTNIHDKSRQYNVISSIQPNLLVYFKGRRRRKAYARNLRRVAATLNSCQEVA